MNLFVTGASGFIGSYFIDKCISNKDSIVALVHNNIPSKSDLDIKYIRKSYLELLPDDFQGIDVLVHFACHSTNVPYDTLDNCLTYNLVQPLNMLTTAKAANVKNFLVIGSCFEYGLSGLRYEYIPPDAPLLPTQAYPASKAAASIAFTQWALESKVSLTVLRLFQIYGEGEHYTRLWPSIMKAIQSSNDFDMTLGEQIRDFSHVSDTASQIYEHAFNMNKSTIPQVIHQNIGTGCPTSVARFAQNIWDYYDATGNLNIGSLPYRGGEVMRYVPDLTPVYLT